MGCGGVREWKQCECRRGAAGARGGLRREEGVCRTVWLVTCTASGKPWTWIPAKESTLSRCVPFAQVHSGAAGYEGRTHLFLYGARGEQAVDPHALLLALPPHAGHGLQVGRRVPVCSGCPCGGFQIGEQDGTHR